MPCAAPPALKAEQGRPQWKRAFGYVPDTAPQGEDDDGTRKVDKDQAKLVRAAYKAVLARKSLGDICTMFQRCRRLHTHRQAMDTAADVELPAQAPQRRSARPQQEIVGKGTWPALVDERTWKAASRCSIPLVAHPAARSYRHLLTRPARMRPSGGYLSGMRTPDNTRIVYSCKSCRGVSIRAEHVERLIYGYVIEQP